MIQLDAQFFKTWRAKYCWPRGKTRQESENEIRCLENLIEQNILNKGTLSAKEVLSKIVAWKMPGITKTRRVESFQNNKDADVENSVKEILRQLKDDPDEVSRPTEFLCTLLKGIGPAIASAFLRFLDPINHRYGIIDINVARVLNEQGITEFKFAQDRYIPYDNRNRDQYQKYHHWLQEKAKELEGTTYTGIDDKQQPFRPVDIEMAIFAYKKTRKTQCK
jgi:thermostable 8-oxoguanine DNA glycosylase